MADHRRMNTELIAGKEKRDLKTNGQFLYTFNNLGSILITTYVLLFQ